MTVPGTSDEQEPQGEGFVKPRNQEVAETTCGARADRVIAACSLPIGHCKTMDDWHESTAKTAEHIQTSAFETTITKLETFRWAPNDFEPSDEKASMRILNRKLNREHVESEND